MVVELFIQHGTSAFAIKDLAAHAGISERSFHRYFPKKEDVVRPFLAAGAERIATIAADRPTDEPLVASLVEAWRGSWAAVHVDKARALHEILRESESFRAHWLQALTDSERRWTQVIAGRLCIDPAGRQAVLAGAAVAAATRLSIEGFAENLNPAEEFAAQLALLGPALFTSPTKE
ncbi:TetR/AcrR family transcriptional regulator [Cryptosporangium aurantiacum]|uniref:TetR/AcrR family transcriptional regulator n=1 Tax=Cryptosporangium aurantiacum TaxID=134849 RepID=UPI0015BC9A71|nr:TetR/AcrR family transcriptional regulator [Cryptosporangium aurantiacum]